MKKFTSIALAGLMLGLCVGAAFAEDVPAQTTLTFDGVVIAGKTQTLSAPYGGTLGDFTVRVGDTVAAGDALFPIDTVKIYAPTDGTVRGLRAEPGDDAAYLQSLYNALLYIQPQSEYTVEATLAEAYNDNDHKQVRPGETVYLVSKSTTDREGEGFITYVDGQSYGVEVTEGDLHINEGVNIHRNDDHSNTSKIGAGATAQMPFAAVTGEGSVLRVHVTEGERVQRGDLLLEMVGGTLAAGETKDAIEAPADGIITAIQGTPGVAVQKDQAVATLCAREDLQVAVTVSELDLAGMKAGDAVDVTFDSDTAGTSLRGEIASISAMNKEGVGDAEYVVYVDVSETADLRIGMNASVQVRR